MNWCGSLDLCLWHPFHKRGHWKIPWSLRRLLTKMFMTTLTFRSTISSVVALVAVIHCLGILLQTVAVITVLGLEAMTLSLNAPFALLACAADVHSQCHWTLLCLSPGTASSVTVLGGTGRAE